MDEQDAHKDDDAIINGRQITEEIFERVYRGYFRPLFLYAYGYVMDEMEAENIVQSVFGTVAMDIVIQGLLADVTRWAASGGGAAGLWLLAAGTAVSVGYVVVGAVLDGLIRRPVLRMLRLGR